MTFVPKMEQLRGLSLEVAECYGKPHIGAYYARDNVKSNQLAQDARCATWLRPATNSHHCPPLSKGRTFILSTPLGMHILKPALIAVCGSGTTGCHNGFHGGARYKPQWVWLCDEYAEMWWDGTILKRIPPHSGRLYQYGYWDIFDQKAVKSILYGVIG